MNQTAFGIIYNEDEQVFHIRTPHTSYLIGIADGRYAGHVYYGGALNDDRCAWLMRTGEYPFVPSVNRREKGAFADLFPWEYPTFGAGDFRDGGLMVTDGNGCRACELLYEGYRIFDEKPPLAGLPSTFAGGSPVQTLEILCRDPVIGLKTVLTYSCFEDSDVLARSVRLVNEGSQPIVLNRVPSACIEMDNRDFEILTLSGAWARERHMDRAVLSHGTRSVGSVRGESSHQFHPFAALLAPGTTQETGEVYAMQFVYSGNFTAFAHVSQADSVRFGMGIHPDGFAWTLEPGAAFQAPEVLMVYSDHGLGGMSRAYHDVIRGHLIRSPWLHRERPILINNWEATYFNFDSEKLLDIARTAKADGIEMLVMDDGWFSRRSSDDSSLGDWEVNTDKIPGGLKKLSSDITDLGMAFGIWMEPEMVSPDSDLYRAHPDWAIAVPGREAALIRCQYVLDLSRPEVCDYVWNCIEKTLLSGKISYLKWDMNRQLTDVGSAYLQSDRQGELMHRYVLGVYALQERLVQRFPDLLLENCSGGGARFDAGMLYYSPQIWCSDDTDAVMRLGIQEGTSLIYPLSSIGAHVSICPNHITGRVTPFMTRAHAALAGTFGYELDITKLSEEEHAMIRQQTAMYHRYQELIREGDYYRIASWQENRTWDAWEVVAKDQSRALVTIVHVLNEGPRRSRCVRLTGLDPEGMYVLREITGDKASGPDQQYGTDGISPADTVFGTSDMPRAYSGDLLMKAGFLMTCPAGDFVSTLYEVVQMK